MQNRPNTITLHLSDEMMRELRSAAIACGLMAENFAAECVETILAERRSQRKVGQDNSAITLPTLVSHPQPQG